MEKDVLKKEITAILKSSKNNSKDKRATAVFDYLVEHREDLNFDDVKALATTLDNSIDTTGYAVDYSAGVMSYYYAAGLPVNEVEFEKLKANNELLEYEKLLAEKEIDAQSGRYEKLANDYESLLAHAAEHSEELKKENQQLTSHSEELKKENQKLTSENAKLAADYKADSEKASRVNKRNIVYKVLSGIVIICLGIALIFTGVKSAKKNETINSLNQDKIGLTEQLNNEKESHQTDNTNNQTKIDQLTEDKNQAETDKKTAENERDAAIADKEAIEKECAEGHITKEEAAAQIAEKDAEIAEKEAEIAEKEAEIENYKKILNEKNESNAATSAQVGEGNGVTPVANENGEGSQPGGSTGSLGDDMPGKVEQEEPENVAETITISDGTQVIIEPAVNQQTEEYDAELFK